MPEYTNRIGETSVREICFICHHVDNQKVPAAATCQELLQPVCQKHANGCKEDGHVALALPLPSREELLRVDTRILLQHQIECAGAAIMLYLVTVRNTRCSAEDRAEAAVSIRTMSDQLAGLCGRLGI